MSKGFKILLLIAGVFLAFVFVIGSITLYIITSDSSSYSEGFQSDIARGLVKSLPYPNFTRKVFDTKYRCAEHYEEKECNESWNCGWFVPPVTRTGIRESYCLPADEAKIYRKEAAYNCDAVQSERECANHYLFCIWKRDSVDNSKSTCTHLTQQDLVHIPGTF